MNIQPIQLIILAMYSALLLTLIYVPYKPIKILAVILAVIIFAVNPVRFQQKGGETIEKSVTRFDDVPEKIIVITKPYEESHKAELQNLKKESGDLKDEIHN